MGLFSLLTLPLTAPVRCTFWTIEQIASYVGQELDGEDRIRQELARLHAEHALGNIDDAQMAVAEELLLERLAVVTATSPTTGPNEEEGPWQS